MPYINTFHTAAALAEDIRQLRRGGGPLTDVENLTEAQVLYWIATGLAGMQADKLALSGQRGNNVLDTDYVELDLPLTYSEYYHAYVSEPIGRVARLSSLPLLKDARIGLSPLAISATGPSRIGYSRFGKPTSVVYALDKRLICDLLSSFRYEEPITLTVLAQVQLDIDTILRSPDDPLLAPQSWIEELRLSLLQPAQVTLQTQPDQTTNANSTK